MLGTSSEKGVVQLAADTVFNFIANCPNQAFILRASFVEVYNEKVKDLLTAGQEEVKIHQDPAKGVFYDASFALVSDLEGIKKVIRDGKLLWNKRKTIF
jgi:hypothetical protein